MSGVKPSCPLHHRARLSYLFHLFSFEFRLSNHAPPPRHVSFLTPLSFTVAHFVLCRVINFSDVITVMYWA